MLDMFNDREFVANDDGAWIARTTHTPDGASDRQCIRFVFNRKYEPTITRRLNLWVSDALLVNNVNRYRDKLALCIQDWLSGSEADGKRDCVHV
jgi:hypothetical protein